MGSTEVVMKAHREPLDGTIERREPRKGSAVGSSKVRNPLENRLESRDAVLRVAADDNDRIDPSPDQDLR